MSGTKSRSISMVAVTMLLGIAFARVGLVQPTRPTIQRSSINDYLPELQRLQQSNDWMGLERLSREILGVFESKSGPDSINVAAASNWLALALHKEGHYTEAEPPYRRALAIEEKVLGPDHAAMVSTLNNLADLLRDQGRNSEAEQLYRRALAIVEKTVGSNHRTTVAITSNLALALQNQGHYEEAEQLYRRALQISEKELGADNADTAIVLDSIALSLQIQGHYADAEPLYRRALAINEKTRGPENPITAGNLSNLANLLEYRGRYGEADAFFRRALGIAEKTFGPEHPTTAVILNSLGLSLQTQGRNGEAEPMYRRALAIDEKMLGPEHPDTAIVSSNLANLLRDQGNYREADPLFHRALVIQERALGPEHPGTATTLGNLARSFQKQGRYQEAEGLYRRALAINEKMLGPEHPGTATILTSLAISLRYQRRYAEAEPLFRRAVAIDEKSLGPEHPVTAGVYENLGTNDSDQKRFGDAVRNLRRACSALSSLRRSRDETGDAAQSSLDRSIACSTRLALSMLAWSLQGGGPEAANRPNALMLEAFSVSQRGVQSAAGDAMARSAALIAANGSAVGPQAEAYEAALLERNTLEQAFAKAAADLGGQGVSKLQALAKSRDDLVTKIDGLAAELKTQAPRYWDYRSPEPVSVAVLQAETGADAALLHDEESLIVFLVAPGRDKGLVFAVNKRHVAWASLGLSGDEIKVRVMKLRAQIDPYGYGLRSVSGAKDAGFEAALVPGAFDRQAAYDLYRALLGDESIQTAIRDTPILLFVPSGVLTSLPPGLLVTSPSAGGAAGDKDPAVLRATPWLIRSKAVALLPTVTSLRTLRQILPPNRASTPDPLLAFADPDFTRPTAALKTDVALGPTRSFRTYFRDGLPLAEALDSLPPLPGTRNEGEALERALGGRPGSLLMGRDASKAQLMARNADGRLAQVRVLEFATHGLVAGDAPDLAEPALALAAGATPADELLLASEAATLKLNADWVLLSACNTASPDAPEAQGLSGLARSFFYAGARSLLVSQWRVRDDVAPLLIPAMLLAERKHPDLSHAEALRQASLAVLDNPTLNAANPSAWAAFTLVGEAGR